MKHPAAPLWRTELPSLILILASIALAIYFQLHFPDRVPTHWNFSGEVDGYSNKFFGAWFGPVLLILMYGLFLGLPFIDPKHSHYAGFRESYHGIKNWIVAFVFVIWVLAGVAGLGYEISMAAVVPVLVGALFAIIGYYIKSVKQNWAMGVRTPWTMENEVVWKKTNHLMSGVMMLAGVMIAICAFPFPNIIKAFIFIVAMVLIIFVPIIYSYFAYKAELKKK